MAIHNNSVKQTLQFLYQKQFENTEVQPLKYSIKSFITQQYGPTIGIKDQLDQEYKLFFPADMFIQISQFLQQRKNSSNSQIRNNVNVQQTRSLPKPTIGRMSVTQVIQGSTGSSQQRRKNQQVTGTPVESFTTQFQNNHEEQQEQISENQQSRILSKGSITGKVIDASTISQQQEQRQIQQWSIQGEKKRASQSNKSKTIKKPQYVKDPSFVNKTRKASVMSQSTIQTQRRNGRL